MRAPACDCKRFRACKNLKERCPPRRGQALLLVALNIATSRFRSLICRFPLGDLISRFLTLIEELAARLPIMALQFVTLVPSIIRKFVTDELLPILIKAMFPFLCPA